MAEGINRLIATQQSPNLLGAITGGVQARQSQQANQMNLQAAQQKQERQNRLLELARQNAPAEQYQQAGLLNEARQVQQLQAGQQNIQAGQQEMLSEQEKRAAMYALALTEGATSMEDFQQRIMSAPESALNQEYKQIALQLGPQGLMRLAGEMDGKREGTAGIQDFEYYQNLKKTDPESAAAFGRERGFISDEGQELSVYLQKRLSDSIDTAVKSENNASSFNTLASEIEGANISGGIMDKWTESLKEITGSQDAVTDLRKQYLGIRSSQAVNNLPPGVASDKDIELALKGFPTESANSRQMASFLRGMAKLEDFNAKFNTFKSDYISKFGKERGMLDAWKQELKAQEELQLPEGVTEDDIQATMEANNMTREQVLQRLNSGR